MLAALAVAVAGAAVAARSGGSCWRRRPAPRVVLVPVRAVSPGWPPPGWLFVACDVGQGDALVVGAGAGTAMVVDAGPDPTAVDGCLRRLGVRSVPLLVLTHLHADHVDGLAGRAARPIGRRDRRRAVPRAGGGLARRCRTAPAGTGCRCGPCRWGSGGEFDGLHGGRPRARPAVPRHPLGPEQLLGRAAGRGERA